MLEMQNPRNINKILPAEILYLIFRHLIPLALFPHPEPQPKDWLHLTRAREVCQLWRDVGEAPGLWQRLRIKVTRKNLSVMPSLLGASRMREVRWINISEEGAVSEELLKEVVKHRGLHKMTFSCNDLSSVDPSLLAKTVNNMEQVWMNDTNVNRNQVEDILVGLTGETKLKRLTILNADLSSVDPDLLVRAVGRLEHIELPREKTLLTDQQSEAIYTAVASGDTKIKQLLVRISSQDLMVRAVNNLEYLGAEINIQDAEAILTQSLLKTSLKKVCLRIRGPVRMDQNIVTEARKVITNLVVRHMDIVGAQHV